MMDEIMRGFGIGIIILETIVADLLAGKINVYPTETS